MLRKKVLRSILRRIINDHPDFSFSKTYYTYMSELESAKHFTAYDSIFYSALPRQLKLTQKAYAFFYLNYEKIKQNYRDGDL